MTKTANGVNREYDDREERRVAEACSLVMESLDKRLSQIAHRMVVVENQIMDWSHQVLIRRHDDTGLMDRSASTPGSSGNYVGTWEAFDVNLPIMRGDELHEDKLVAKTREMSCTRTISLRTRGEMRAAMRQKPGLNLKTPSSRLKARPRWINRRASYVRLPVRRIDITCYMDDARATGSTRGAESQMWWTSPQLTTTTIWDP